MNRRHFIISGLAAGGYVAISRSHLESIAIFQRSPMGTAIVGCGERGTLRLAECRELPGVSIKTVCDIDKKALDRVGRLLSKERAVEITSDMQTIIRNPEIESVCVAVPIQKRAKLVKTLVASGKRVFVEAPWANSIAESAGILEVVKSSGGFVYQASSDPDWPEELIREQLIRGATNIQSVHLNLNIPTSTLEPNQKLMQSGFDVLSTVAKWVNVGAPASISALSTPVSVPFASTVLRIESVHELPRSMVMVMQDNPAFEPGQIVAQIEATSSSGQKLVLAIHSHPQEKLESSINRYSAIERFMKRSLTATAAETARIAEETHQINSYCLTALEKLSSIQSS